MRLVKLLSSVVTERSTPKSVLLEISTKLKASLAAKFKEQTSDSLDTIGEYIDEFEKYKNGLPADKRDLSKFNYPELKKIIDTKKFQKNEKELFTKFKKKEEKLERVELARTVRKFLEIQSKFGKVKDPSNYKFLDFSKLVNQVYPKYIKEILMDKFKKENTAITEDILDYYISSYVDNFDELYSQMPPPTQLTFSDFEHYIDGMNKGLANATGKESTEDIEIVYDDNNLIIFQPKTRDQCIRLKNGRSWCTSREGSSNLFYNYRLDNRRTLYYVIDQDKEYSDLNFAVVVLVDPDGDMSLADGSNSGRYSGHQNIPWNEIVTKIPKLKNLKEVFKPKPLTQEELEVINQIRNTSVGDNPIEDLGSEERAEMWLEIRSPRLNDKQFENLTVPLRKKYIALGHDLTAGMINVADPDTKKYYVSKQIDSIKTKSLNQLSDSDIAILNLPGMTKLKEEMKKKFATDFQSGDNVTIKIPAQKEGKYIALYGFDELIKNLSSNVKFFEIICTEKNYVQYDLPSEFCDRFTQLETLVMENIVASIPENISNLRNLTVLNLKGNKELKTLPSSILQMSNLDMVILRNAPNDFTPPQGFEEYFEDMGDNFFYRTKFD
jgi:hypothetical protein